MSQRTLFPKGGLPTRLRADFEAFWAAYPPRRPNPRALAEAAFAKAVQAGAAPSDLVAAATAYAAEVMRKGVGEDFIVHARTFLAQARFLDYLAAPAERAPAPRAPRPDPDHPLWRATLWGIGLVEFERWIAPLAVVTHSEGDAALLQAPSRFHRDWVRQHYAVALKAALRVRLLDIDTAEDIRP
jgi:hypothetical protein